MRSRPPIKIIIERHTDGYIGYPIGLKGVVVGQGDTYADALRDTQSAIRFHIESFGSEAFDGDEVALDAYVAEADVS